MMNLPWWVIVIAVIAIVMIILIVKGMVVARRCRNIFKKEDEKVPEPELDEDFESGDAENS